MQDPSSKEKIKDASASLHSRLLDQDSKGKKSFIFGSWFPESNSNQKLSDNQRKELSQRKKKERKAVTEIETNNVVVQQGPCSKAAINKSSRKNKNKKYKHARCKNIMEFHVLVGCNKVIQKF